MESMILNFDKPNVSSLCTKYGFFYLPFEEEDKKLVTGMLSLVKKYFNQPVEIKNKDLMGKNGLGYSPSNKINKETKIMSTKESFSYRPSGDADPLQLPYNKYCERMKIIAEKIFKLVVSTITSEKCTELVDQRFNTLSLIHYPDIKSDPEKKIYGIRPHSDWGLVTILYTDTDGLEININGNWIPIPALQDHFIVNIGDMMEILSGGKYHSTLHQVLVNQEKYSMAYFFEPKLDAIIKPLTESSGIKAVKYEDYFKEKMKETYGILLDSTD